ncbi:MAG: hypothetical protein EA415_03850 [Sphaerobacteraceae bacterium]|nr:MAG: hypothetical protein EA415_03850 [Sphaerobacteraceae bacterium]
MKRFWISMIAAGLLTIAAIAPAAADEHSMTIDLDEVDGSGVSGTATMTETDGETTVSIELDGTPEDGVHPVHIHAGTCDDLGDVVFPLEDVVDGMSESTVEASIDDIMAADHAINVHLSEDEMDVYVACGNIGTGDEEDDAVMDDDAVAEDDDDAVTDYDDDAVAEDDDAAVEDDDAAVTDDDDAEAADDADAIAEEDDAADDAEDLVPATGGVAGFGAEAGILMMTLAAGLTLGAGVLIRRRSLQI